MGKLTSLYAYQQADARRDKLENELKQTVNYKHYEKLRTFIEQQRKVLQKINQQESSRIRQMENAEQFLARTVTLYEEGLQKYNAAQIEDTEELAKYRRYFEQLRTRLEQERQNFAELVKRLESEEVQLADMRVKLSKTMKDYEATKKQVEEERESVKAEREALKEAAQALAKDVPEDLLARYEDIKRSHAMPVALVAGERCRGCNMLLATALVRRLKEDMHVVECENCGRMLYLESEKS